MTMQMKRSCFNLAKNCVAPLLENAVKPQEKIELAHIKSITDNYASFMSFKACCTKTVQEEFFKLVTKYKDDLTLSFEF